jgi:pyrroloquinoline quinone biosynthesis protein D
MPSTTPTQPISSPDRLRVAAHVRLTYDPARERHVLLSPEAVAVLNGTGVAVLRLCDGTRTVAEIVTGLRARYDRVDDAEVQRFLDHLAARRYVEAARG